MSFSNHFFSSNHFATIAFVAVLFTGIVARANDEAIQQVTELGGTVRQIAASVEDREAAFHLSDKEITDEALKPLASIDHLAWLYLQGTKITDDGLQYIGGITTLTKLHLEKTEIGDAGVQHLSGLENLEYLNLYGTKVTDAGLDHLKGLKKLRKIYLWQSAVTEDGAEALRKALPDAEVVLGAKLAVVTPAEPKDEPTADKTAEKPAEEAKPEEPPKSTLSKGKFVRVRLSGESKILSLAEVVVQQTGDGAVLQVDGKATQSSVDYSGEPKHAIDGNTNQNFNDGSVTHTKAEKDPWWQLELNDTKDIGRIKVYNRGDCCGDRLADAIVEVLDESQKVVWEKSISDAKDGSVHQFAAEEAN